MPLINSKVISNTMTPSSTAPPLKINKKKRKTIEDVFKQINRCHVKINSNHRKQNNEILKVVLNEFIKTMQTCDVLFESMKPRIEYLGSYYDGLRVGHPTEYDLNLILKIPVDYKKITLDGTKAAYDYVNILTPSAFRRLATTTETASKGFERTNTWCDKEYRLSVTKFRSWMQSVVDAALTKLPQIDKEEESSFSPLIVKDKKIVRVAGKCYPISVKISGPANTLNIITGSTKDDIIDVDLVPTFEFVLPKKPVGTNVLFENIESTKIKQYYVVPKPSDDDFSWRLTFPFQERFYMKNKYNFKSAVKLIKLLRDVQGFKQLASYFIKTVCLWEIKKQPDNFWKKHALSYLVIHLLKQLRDCLAKGNIRNFWCPEYNLIYGKIKTETCENWSNRLTTIINDIEQNSQENPRVVFDYFTKKETTTKTIVSSKKL